MFRRLTSTSATWVPLPLRLAMATIFVAHGAQKVLGSFNGPGLEKWISISPPFSFMRPGWLWLGAAAFSELIGGILIFLGLLTRVGAFLIACTMLTALVSVHWPSFFVPKGIEYPLSLLAICLALLISGGGMASVDLAISGGRRR
ncbi:MAG TPA: DoxX family protein [Pyrinomonadaceae bacterium]|nr:DoxX family protein [Pyrinomonadaceae bacterium]